MALQELEDTGVPIILMWNPLRSSAAPGYVAENNTEFVDARKIIRQVFQ